MQELAKINFQIVKPSDDLKEYVQSIWFINNHENKKDKKELIYKVLSECGSGLVYNLADSIDYEINKTFYSFKKAPIILGPTKFLMKFIFKGEINAVGIRFFPATGHLFFKHKMNELSDKVIEASESFANALDLDQKLKKASNQADIIKFIEDHLRKILEQTKANDSPVLRRVIEEMNKNTDLCLEDICQKFHLPLRELQRLFKSHVGVAPNIYIRINKIFHVKTKIAANDFDTLTNLSYNNGYYDQAHFIREFKAFMEETPKRYNKLKRS